MLKKYSINYVLKYAFGPVFIAVSSSTSGCQFTLRKPGIQLFFDN